jgi:DNA-directed RNA polymerase II subunit RPB2
MVNDKAHSRSIGPMVNLTRQPAEGRSRDGGLRFGEMERYYYYYLLLCLLYLMCFIMGFSRDCMVAHGGARFVRERMYDVSDKYVVHVCKECGMISAYNDNERIHHCLTCENRVSFARVEIPYSCKLLFQELNAMNIAPRLLTDI